MPCIGKACPCNSSLVRYKTVSTHKKDAVGYRIDVARSQVGEQSQCNQEFCVACLC